MARCLCAASSAPNSFRRFLVENMVSTMFSFRTIRLVLSLPQTLVSTDSTVFLPHCALISFRCYPIFEPPFWRVSTCFLWPCRRVCPLLIASFSCRVNSLSVSPVDDSLLSTSLDSTLRLWDMREECATALISSGDGHAVVCFAPQGDSFCTVSTGNSFKSFDRRNLGRVGAHYGCA
jgi:WD40 repeat protein